MFCPTCKCEYLEGFTTCADCSVPLVAQLPPEPVEEELESEANEELSEGYEYECVRCGCTVQADDKVCPNCGDSLEQFVGMENSPDTGEETKPDEPAPEGFSCAKCGREITEEDNHVISVSTQVVYYDIDALFEAEGDVDWLPVCLNCFDGKAGTPGDEAMSTEPDSVAIREDAKEQDAPLQTTAGIPKCPRCQSDNTEKLYRKGKFWGLFPTKKDSNEFKCNDCKYDWQQD